MSNTSDSEETTHFGYEEVPVAQKEQRVGQVFASVAKSLRHNERCHVARLPPAH